MVPGLPLLLLMVNDNAVMCLRELLIGQMLSYKYFLEFYITDFICIFHLAFVYYVNNKNFWD